MKKGGLFLAGILFACCNLSAQSLFDSIESSDGKIIFVPRKPDFDYNIVIPEPLYTPYTPSKNITLNVELKDLIRGYRPISLSDRPMDMQVISSAYQSFFNVYTPMLRRMSPMALDFRETSIVPLSSNVALFAVGEQYTWPAAGGMTYVSPGVVWKNDRLSVAGYGFAGRFYTPFNINPAYTGGGGLQVQYQLTDWMAVKTWGQYAHFSGNEKYNPHMLLNPSFNHTNAGGTFEFKINENFGMGMGVNYEYNPRRRRMEPQYLVYPIFHSKNAKIRLW